LSAYICGLIYIHINQKTETEVLFPQAGCGRSHDAWHSIIHCTDITCSYGLIWDCIMGDYFLHSLFKIYYFKHDHARENVLKHR